MKPLKHYKHKGHPVYFFRDKELAYRHIRDHLLTYPECLAWKLISPNEQFEKIFDDNSTYFYHVKTLREGDIQLFRLLYEYYLDSVEHQLISAMKLGWASYKTTTVGSQIPDSISENGDAAKSPEKTLEIVVMMGISGALILIEGTKEDAFYCVKTVFLGGQGDSQGIVEARYSNRRNDDAPIQRIFRVKTIESKKSSRQRMQVEARQRENLSSEEKTHRDIFGVFRRSWQRIRDSYDSNRDALGNLCGTDFAVLKDIVPKLNFDQWREKFISFN
jgi:hypothetical protein